MLWPVLDEIFQCSFRYDNSSEAVKERQAFLRWQELGICDIVESCRRVKIDASDLGMEDIQLRDIVEQIRLYPTIDALIFTGGNTRNGPEYLFRRQLRSYGLRLQGVAQGTPRINRFFFQDREITTVSLTSPSNAANMAIGGNPLYKQRKKANPSYSTFDFRVEQYRKVFLREK